MAFCYSQNLHLVTYAPSNYSICRSFHTKIGTQVKHTERHVYNCKAHAHFALKLYQIMLFPERFMEREAHPFRASLTQKSEKWGERKRLLVVSSDREKLIETRQRNLNETQTNLFLRLRLLWSQNEWSAWLPLTV